MKRFLKLLISALMVLPLYFSTALAVTPPPGADGHTHRWDAWTVYAQPTCTQKGSRYHICKYCKLKNWSSINPLGHDWGEWSEATPKLQ